MASSKVVLHVLTGPLKDQEYVYDSHDTFFFGRDPDCHASVPSDRFVSRHHFVMDINPPIIQLRDLGSLNGTSVNDKKLGGSPRGETQLGNGDDGGGELILNDGDIITVGSTRIRVAVFGNGRCRLCRMELTSCRADTHGLCASCLAGNQATEAWNATPRSVRCVKCHAEASMTGLSSSDYTCAACSAQGASKGRILLSQTKGKERARSDRGKRQLAGYLLGKVLGKGGMGVVYKAHAIDEPDRSVAVKVILADPASDEKAIRRVLREIGIGLELNHERIVRMLAHGSIGNLFYVVMELCDGGNLERLLKKHGGRLATDKAVRLMKMCLEGMEYAHRHDVVHRDLKPANILLYKGKHGKLHPKISDFGLAKTIQLAGLSGMTATGTFGGSWYYMPREQLTHFKFVAPVSDVWSLGATFYQVLTGRFTREFPPKKDPIQVVLEDEAIPIRERDPSIPRPLAEIIDRALLSDPAARFQNATEMRLALTNLA